MRHILKTFLYALVLLSFTSSPAAAGLPHFTGLSQGALGSLIFTGSVAALSGIAVTVSGVATGAPPCAGSDSVNILSGSGGSEKFTLVFGTSGTCSGEYDVDITLTETGGGFIDDAEFTCEFANGRVTCTRDD